GTMPMDGAAASRANVLPMPLPPRMLVRRCRREHLAALDQHRRLLLSATVLPRRSELSRFASGRFVCCATAEMHPAAWRAAFVHRRRTLSARNGYGSCSG